MLAPPDDLAARDRRRLAEVERYELAALRASGRRHDLDGLARLAARVCDASMAMITFIDETHLRTISTTGFPEGELPRALSLCNQVLYDGHPLLGEDLAADPRYADSFPVTQGIARFYASQQLLTPSGEPIGSLCVFDIEPKKLDDGQREALSDLAERVIDVLELELRTRDLSRVVGELRRSNESLEAFAGQVSHDLRNPLAALTGTLEIADDLLDADPPDLDQVRPLVRRAQSTAERMAELIGDVLDLAGVGGELHVTEVDVQELVAEVQVDLAPELAHADLHVEQLAPAHADRVHLRVLVQNLLSNAAKYAVPGQRADITVATTTRPGWWRLVVVDHGRGIRPDDRERVFEPFTRAEASVPGTGVGLATCRRVAEAHGGAIGIADTPGGGTTVWLEIPSPHVDPPL